MKKIERPLLIILTYSCLLFILNNAVAQTQTTSNPFLTVDGEVRESLLLTMDDFTRFKQTEVKANDKNNNAHVYKGVTLAAILDSAGTTLGKELRKENLSKCVIVEASDGYKVLFSLAEIDPEFTDQIILVAYHLDNNPLPNHEGPFRIIVPNDKNNARWVRDVHSIKVIFPAK